MFSEGLCVKGLVSAWCYWEMEEPLRGGVQWGVLGHWWCNLEGDSMIPDSSFSLLPGYHKMNGFFCKAPLP